MILARAFRPSGRRRMPTTTPRRDLHTELYTASTAIVPISGARPCPSSSDGRPTTTL